MTNTTITLRPVEHADAAYLMGLMNHEQVADRSMLTQHVTLPRALQSIKEAQDPSNVLDMWMVIRGKKRVGKVNSIRLGNGDVLLGFSVSPECQGKGAATEGLRQLIALLTNKKDKLNRLQALVEPDNMPSKRVLEKNDFGLVGLIERSATLGSGANRDLLLYEIVL